MASLTSHYTSLLDIGSSKVVCLICSPSGKDGIVVHGAGIGPYSGYRRGLFADDSQLISAIADSVSAAEHEAKRRVRDLAVGVPAPFSHLALHKAEVEVSSRSGRIGQRDIEELINRSLEFEQPEGFELTHSTPVEFMVDGAERHDPPIGEKAAVLSGLMSHAYVSSYFKRLAAEALLRIDLEADMFISVPLSQSLFIIPEEDRFDGALLIDVGYTHTDISYVKHSALISCSSIDVGGAHFSGDLAFGLKIPADSAEDIKRRYVYSLDYQDSIDTIRVGGGTLRIEHEAIQYIVESRTDELAKLIINAVETMGLKLCEGFPVYLTGGGVALMRGSGEYLGKCLSTPVEVRMRWMPRLSSPNYTSAFGVMDFMTHSQDDAGEVRLETGARGRMMKKIKDFFVK